MTNRASNRARVVAGYRWTWPSKRDPAAWDIEIEAGDEGDAFVVVVELLTVIG